MGSGKVTEDEIGTIEQFKSAVKDEASARRIYSNLIGSGKFSTDEIGTEDQFYQFLSDDFAAPAAETESTTGGSSASVPVYQRVQQLGSQVVDKARETAKEGEGETAKQVAVPQINPFETGWTRKVQRAYKRATEGPQRIVTPGIVNGEVPVGIEPLAQEVNRRGLEQLRRRVEESRRGVESAGVTAYNPELKQFVNAEGKVVDPLEEKDEQLWRQQHPAEAEYEQTMQEQREIERMIENRKNELEEQGYVRPYGSKEYDPVLKMLRVAERKNNKRMATLEREIDEEGFFTTLGKTLFNGDTWDMGIGAAKDASTLSTYGEKELSGEEEKARQKMLENTYLEQVAKERWGSNDTFWQRAGEITGNAVPFVAEFYLTGGFNGISKAGTFMGEMAASRYASRKATEWLLKNTGTLAGDVAASFVFANTTGAGRTYADILNRRQGELTRDEEGKYVFKDGSSWLNAIVKGELANTIEYFTEKFGVHLDGAGAAVKKWFGKGGKKAGAGVVSDVLNCMNGSDWMKYTKNVLAKGGVNEIPAEVAEEELNIILNAAFVGDNKFSDLWDYETQRDIIGGMALSIGSMRTPVFGKQYATYKYLQHRVNNADAAASSALGEERWNEMRTKIDGTTNANMKDVALDDDMSREQKMAVANYIKNLMMMRGYNLRTMAEARDKVGETAKDGTPGANAVRTVELGQTIPFPDGSKGKVMAVSQDGQSFTVVFSDGKADKRMTVEDLLTPEMQAEEQKMNEEYQRGYDADAEERKNIALEVAKGGAQAAWEAVQQRIKDDADDLEAKQKARYENSKYADGSVRPVTLKTTMSNGTNTEGYIVSGDVVMSADGESVDKEKSSSVVYVYVPATDERIHIDPAGKEGVLSLGEVTSQEEALAGIEQGKQQYIQQQIDEATNKVTPGYTYSTNDGENVYRVMSIDGENATVYNITTGEDENVPLAEVQKIADEALEASSREREAEEVENVVEGKPEVFERDMEVTVKGDDGEEKTVVVTGVRARWEDGKFIEDPNGRYVEMYDPEAGAMTYIHETDPKKQIVGWKEAPKEEQEVEEPVRETEVTQEETVAERPTEEVEQMPREEAATESVQQEETPAGQPAGPISDNNIAMPMVETTTGRGKSKKTERVPNWYAATPSRAQHYIYNELGFTPEVADEVVKANMTEIDKAIADKQKKEPKPTANPLAYKEAHDAWENEMQELRGHQQYWNEVRSARNREMLAEAEERDRMKAEVRASAAEQKAVEAQQRAEEEALARQRQEEERARAAAAAEAEEGHFLENEIFEGVRKEMGREYERGLQEREKKINNAISMKQKRAAAREIYGELYNDDLEVPADVNEYVSMHLVAKEEKDKVNWDMVDDRYGVKHEIGGTSNGGKKKGKNAGDFDHLGAVISFDNKGKSFQQAAHDMWDSAENTLPGGYKRFDEQDIRNAMIDIISSAESITDITQYSFKNRVKNAEESMESQMNDAIGREVDWRIQQSGLTWGEYLEWYREIKEKAAAVEGMTEEEFTNTIILGENGNRGTEESIDGAQPGSPVVGEERPRESGNDGRGREAGSEALRGAEGERPGVVQDSGRGNEEVAGGEREAEPAEQPAGREVERLIDELVAADEKERAAAGKPEYNEAYNEKAALADRVLQVAPSLSQEDLLKIQKVATERGMHAVEAHVENELLRRRELSKQKGEADIAKPSKEQKTLVKALADLLNKMGIKTSLDWKKGQKVLDEYREQAKLQKGEPNPIFFSNAMRAVEGIKQEKATAEQWLAMLQKNGGLKAGEDKWTGLSEWLKENGKESLTKQEVMDYLRENAIEVEEVEYSEDTIKALQEEYDKLVEEKGDKGDAWSAMNTRYMDKYDVYLEDYVTNYDGALEVKRGKEYGFAKLGLPKPINSTRLGYTTDFLDNKREIALTVPTIEPWNEGDDVHFGDAGEGRAVAWVRFGETTDADGKRVLVIDEIQSKRHQEGREKGYRGDLEKEKNNAEKKYRAAQAAYDDYYNEVITTHSATDYFGMKDPDIVAKLDRLGNERDNALQAYNTASAELSRIQKGIDRGIPDAPFEKNWHEVAFKRMLRYAAENGFDKVAWTKGEQQAERYSLGHKVYQITSTPYEAQSPSESDGHDLMVNMSDGTRYEMFVQPDGTLNSNEELFDGKNVADVFGKELGNKIMSATEETDFSGNDLRVGAEGMKGFYDQILPRFMDKYGKRWRVKTGETVLPNVGNGGLTMHSVDVTDEMKESVMEGQPMFFRDKDGEVIGYTLGGEIYIDPRYAKPETPVHEYAHLIVHAIRANNPQVWERWKQLAHGEQDVIDFVKAKYPEYSENEDDFWEEVIANYTGREGGKRLEEEMSRQMHETPDIGEKARIATIFHKLRDLLRRFWDMTKDIFSGSTKGIDNFQSMDDVVDLTLAALANKYDPREVADRKRSANDKAYMDAVERGDMETAQRNADVRYQNGGTYTTKDGVQLSMMSLFEGSENLESGVDGSNGLNGQGETGDLTTLRLRKLEPGETCHVERRYEENKSFSFMGKERIESMDDVAYIFKQLENAAVENSFVVLVKDGKPTIIHTGMGSYAATSVDVRQAMVAYEAIKPDKVYFVHNHPSGSLKASVDDRNTLQAMRAIFGNDVVQDGIIIDTTSGKYGVFGWDVSERDMQEGGDEVPLKVYEFSKQVFSEGWKPQTALKIVDSKGIAEFISSQRFGEHPKMSFIIVNNQLQVVSNLFLPWTKLSDIKDMDAACRELSGNINLAGGMKGIIYGNYQYDKNDKRLLQQLTAGMKAMQTPLLDVVHVDINDELGYHSAHDAGVMEPEEVYVTPKREAGEDIFAYAERVADDYSAYEAIIKAYEDAHGGVMEVHDDSGKYKVPKRKPGESPIDYAKRVAESYSAYNEKRDALNKAAERQISHINNDGTDDIWKDKGFNMQERIIMAAASLAKRNKNNKKLQYDVQKSIVKNLNDIRKKIGTQTGYDSETVMRVANQARIMDQLGMLDEDSREAIDLLMSEVQRNFGGENIDNDIRKVVDILSNVTSENIKKVEKIISTDKYDVPKAQAKESYERMMASGRNQFVEAVQDKMQSLKLLYKSILEGEGKDKVRVEDVAGYENAILAENRMSGANNKQTFAWIKTYMEPLTDEVYKLCKGKRLLRKGYRKDLYNELVNYMLAKHGLERNDVFAKREARKAYNDEYDAAVRDMNNTHGLVLKELKNKLDNNKIDKDTYEREVEKVRLDVERLKLQFAEDRDDKIASFETNPESDSKYMEYRGQDYAGLTSLTGEADVNKAEMEAQRIVDEYEAKHDTKALWEKINDATKSSLRKLYDSGMMSTERYEKIRDMFQYYIPLQGFDEKVAENVYAYMGSDGTLGYGTPIRAAKGRKSKADDPLATIRMNGEAAIRQANRNDMKQHFLRFVQNHPSDLVSINDVWLRKNDVTGEWEQYFDADLKETDTPADVQKMVYEFEKKMEALANEKPDEYKRSKDLPNVPFRVVEDRDMRQHQVLVNSAGKSYVLTVNGNPRAAQALNGLTNPDVNTESLVGKALNMAQSATRFRSLLVTSLSPEFVLSNYLRDMGYSNLMVWVKENPRYAAEFNKQFAALGFPTGIKIVKKDFENMGSLYVKWKSGKLLKKINDGTANEREKMFYEFQMNGGETGWTSWHNIEQHKKDLEKTLKRSGKISKKFWGLFEGWLDLFNQVVENNARFAAYVASRKTGRSIEHSIRDAKEISVNFNTKGAGDKFITAKGQKPLGIAGSVIGGYGRGFMMFFNAGIQGTFGNFAKNILQHPAKGAGLISAMAALGYFAPIISEALCNAIGGDDDDDKSSYYNLPEYKRRTNLCFRWDKDMPWITIPLPIEFRAAYGIGELTQGIVSGKERYSDTEAAEQYASQLSQLLPKDILEGRGLHLDFGFWPSILTPSLLEPIAQANDNVSWTGLPIYREEPIYYKGKGDPKKYYPQWRYRPFDSADKTLIYATKWLNEATSGDDVKQGWIDWNPSKIEYLINQYLGGPMQMVGKVKKTIETSTGDRDFEWRNTPFLNRVLYEGDERTVARKLQNEYYKLLDEYFETGAVHKGYEELAEGDGKDAEKYRRKLKELEESDAYKHFQIFDKYNDICYDYYKLQKDAEGEEKKKYQKIQNELNRRLVKIVHASDDGDKANVEQAEQEMEEYIKTLN